MSAPTNGARAGRTEAPARPRLEGLEARDVPAIIVGTLDQTFGTAGKVNTPAGFQAVLASGVDNFGRVVVAGTAPGAGGGPRVLAISGRILVAAGADAAEGAPLANFFVGDPTTRGGVRVAAKPTGIGTRANIVVGSGEDLFSDVRVYFGVIPPSGEPTPFQDINPYNQVLAGGVYVG